MKVTATCHCGAIRVTARLRAGLETAQRCDCSFCKRRQAANVAADWASLAVDDPAGALRRYQFGTNTAEHYFWGTCGIYTHHRRRSDPTEAGINIGCIADVNPADLEPIRWTDGQNHPSDRT